MKIGIITFHAARNYGAVLQAYALQTYLQKLGHEPFFINYKFHWNPSLYSPRAWLSRTLLGMLSKINDNILRRTFFKFQEKHLVLGSCRYFGFQELLNNPPEAEAYICGSDQIWKPNNMHSSDKPVVWLGFGNDNVRRISYAASFGIPDLDDATCKSWSGYARHFHSISVREKDGVDLMKKLGRDDAVWVPDPTLLLDASEYDIVESKRKEQQAPYFFEYMIGTDNDGLASSVINAVHESLGVVSRKLLPSSFSYNLFHSGFKGPDEWVARLHRSVLVVTNSFHGLVFSLLFHRPFIILLREQKAAEMNSRVLSLLNVVGLPNHAISVFDHTQVERLCGEEIDWSLVDARLNVFREKGFQFIREALA
jgi:hypothetical protein